jgi:peptidoglycan/LPS O-acetylase OafA/YrhL
MMESTLPLDVTYPASKTPAATPIADRSEHAMSQAGAQVINSATRLPALDGVRGIAILLVLVWHLLYQLQNTPGFLQYPVYAGRLFWSGVDLFFVLSGFLIGGILLDSTTSPRYFRAFYARRGFRILPLYVVLVGLCSIRFLPFHWLTASLGDLTKSSLPWIGYLTFTQNVWMTMRGTLGVGTLSPTWSLCIEEQFYLLIPILIRKISRSSLAILLTFVVVGTLLLRIVLFKYYHHGAIACAVLMPSRADTLSLGVLSALLVRDRKYWNWIVAQKSILRGVAAVLLAALGVLTYAAHRPGVIETVGFSCLALFYTCFLLLVLAGPGGALQRLLTYQPLMQLGTISYFVYLFHLPITEALRRFVNNHVSRPSDPAIIIAVYAAGVTATLIVAQISWRFFEKPLIRVGRNFTY